MSVYLEDVRQSLEKYRNFLDRTLSGDPNYSRSPGQTCVEAGFSCDTRTYLGNTGLGALELAQQHPEAPHIESDSLAVRLSIHEPGCPGLPVATVDRVSERKAPAPRGSSISERSLRWALGLRRSPGSLALYIVYEDLATIGDRAAQGVALRSGIEGKTNRYEPTDAQDVDSFLGKMYRHVRESVEHRRSSARWFLE